VLVALAYDKRRERGVGESSDDRHPQPGTVPWRQAGASSGLDRRRARRVVDSISNTPDVVA
jgi:hypothetical protein